MEAHQVRREILAGLLLTLITLLVYWQVTNHEFVSYDDDAYVTENQRVQQGLTRSTLAWSLTAEVCANWHPVTLWSHMLDVELHGLDAGGHHLTSVLFHVANTLMLFVVLGRMTGAVWRCAFVAALFALHPLHVESVAWVAERKDVLSTFFWFLTLGSYAWYAARPGVRRYLPVLVFFIVGLMSKPMLVTLPFVLLLLDFWPLNRFRFGQPGGWRLVLEKVPLLALAAASSVITYLVQQGSGAIRSAESFPIAVRVGNALVSYVAYLGKMIWPVNLAVLYPHPRMTPSWQVAGAALLLMAVSVLAIRCAKRHPYVTVGWLWYVGTLVPVIGLVQVGNQSMADRYTYVPLTGIFVVLAWGVPEVAARWRHGTKVPAVVAALVLAILAVATWKQTRRWTDSITLYEHTLDVTTDNYHVHNNLGLALEDQGRRTDAIGHYSEALRINPGFAKAHNNLGSALRKEGRTDEAIGHLLEAVRMEPENSKAHNNLANCLATRGREDDAIHHYSEALRIDPDYVLAHYNLAISLKKQGRDDEAIFHYSEALRVDPGLARAHNNLGVILRDQGRTAEAIDHFVEALRIDPDYDRARQNLEKAQALQRQ